MRVERSVFDFMENEIFLSQAIDIFLNYLSVRKNRSSTTVSTYKSALSLFIKFTGDMPLSKFSPRVVDEYALYLQRYEYSTKTFYNKLSPIRSMVKMLYAKDMTSVRPESIDLPFIEDTEANFLDINEQRKMLNACRDKREVALFLTLTRSGVRISELCNIKTEDVFDRSIVVRKGKGRKSRITFIAADAELAVRDYHSTLSFTPEYLFCGKTGRKLSRQYVWRIIKEVSDRAKICKKVSPHTMRHTCGTNMLMNGASIQDVQKILGHANINTTLIYAHFTNDYLKNQYDKSTPIIAVSY